MTLDAKPEVLIPIGLPASGKTTWSKQWCGEAEGRVRINYDDLRLEMFGEQWIFNFTDEKLMKHEARKRAHHAISLGKSIVIDNTNLTESARAPWEALASSFGIRAETIEFDTPVSECVARDRQRTGKAHVGRAVIERMALFNGLIDWADPVLYPRDFIIVDMDGTIADCGWRRKLAFEGPTKHTLGCPVRDSGKFDDRECPECGGKSKKNWPLFAANVEKDPPIQPIITLIEHLSDVEYESSSYDVIIVSGREIGPSGKGTEEWLKQHMRYVAVRHLFMRQTADYRADDIIKQEILDLLPKERIKYVFDDRRRVVDMWRRNGLTCLQVADGEF